MTERKYETNGRHILHLLIITSCTGEKRIKDPHGLTPADFRKGPKHVASRERELKKQLTSAQDLYTGEQHLRLMRGIEALKAARPDVTVDLWILSAGYGLIRGDRKIAPYEMTFNEMGKADLRDWSSTLRIPEDVRATLAEKFDLGLLLLGETYLDAAALDAKVKVGGPVIAFCGKPSVPKLGAIARVTPVQLANKDAKRFACGMVGLKGELAKRILGRIASGTAVKELIGAKDLLGSIETPAATPEKRPAARANASVDHVITIPKAWWEKPHRKRLRYFIPEWDDLVDPDYDFETDTHSGGTGDWSNEVYAHQMYPEPSYDGILVSRAVAQKSKKKDARINAMGVHRFLRVPREFPIMGDCGAFDYIEQKEPPYTTDDVLNYYTRLDFDYGVSVDHLIVPAFYADKQFRYDLTIQNAEDFLREHRKRGLTWEPIGAVQGWDAKSYADAAAKYARMGYRYLALGGLVRCQTPEILATVEAVRGVIPQEVMIHVLGFSRFDAIRDLDRLGVNSIDSASMLRKAWLGARLNFLTLDGWYSAIRIPQSDGSFRAKRLKTESRVDPNQLHRLEQSCLREIRTYAAAGGNVPEKLVRLLHEYDVLIAGERPGTEKEIRRTLQDRPWERCGCAICREWGVEVVIFRGNNRNRRRGFHNTHVFYQLLQKIVNGERIGWLDDDQLDLPIN